MNTTQQFKKQLPRNAITAIMQFFVACLIAVWLTPYLIKHLGPAGFGLVPLATLLTQYVAIITAQLSLAVRRFLIIEMQKPGGNPNIVFNSAFALFLILIVIQLPLFIVAVLNINVIFTIPAELLIDAKILFLCTSISFLLTLLFGVFAVSVYANNRLDISSGIDLVRGILRLVSIVILFALFGPKLRYIGFVEVGVTVFAGICNLYYWRKLTPDLSINFRNLDVKIFPPIFKMSSWTLVNNFGAMLYMRTDIWIINKFISPIAAGQYAAILVIVEFIRRIGLLISNQSGPVIMNYFAKEEWDSLRKLLQMWTKITAIIVAVPVGIICARAPELLQVWLGDDYVSLAPVLWIAVIHLFINIGVGSQPNLQMAANKVKLPGLATLLTGIINVAFVYYLGIILDLGVIGVVLGGAIVITLKNVLFTTIYGAIILNLPKTAFIKPLFNSLLVFVFAIICGLVPISDLVGLDTGYASLGLSSAYIMIFTLIFTWFFLVTKHEKLLLLELLPKKFTGNSKKFIRI